MRLPCHPVKCRGVYLRRRHRLAARKWASQIVSSFSSCPIPESNGIIKSLGRLCKGCRRRQLQWCRWTARNNWYRQIWYHHVIGSTNCPAHERTKWANKQTKIKSMLCILAEQPRTKWTQTCTYSDSQWLITIFVVVVVAVLLLIRSRKNGYFAFTLLLFDIVIYYI